MIGLGSYTFFWQHSDRVDDTLSLRDAFIATREWDVELFQICDHAPLDAMSEREVRDEARAARDLGLTIELGTKGVSPDRLERYLRLAEVFDARLVRSMLSAPDSQPDLDEAERWLRSVIGAYESAGVTLALETYEQWSTADMVALIDRIGSDALGICLDPANPVARIEPPRTCVETAARVTKNVHVKDFAFDRQSGWVGFTYSGAPMGAGLHDYEHLLDTVRPRERGINEIVEHWLPWQGDAATTVRVEREWTQRTLDYLRASGG